MAEENNKISENLKKLLSICKIKHVYYIDDELNTDIPVEKILGKVLHFNEGKDIESLNIIEQFIAGFDPFDIFEMQQVQIRTEWENLNLEKKQRLMSKISDDEDNNSQNSDGINQFLPVDMLTSYSPSEWDDKKTNISCNKTEEGKYLLIFDEDLSHAGGHFETDGGADLIYDIKNNGQKDNFICTLLTHLIDNSSMELKYRESVVKILKNKDKEIKKEDFYALSKERLNDFDDFADGIKKVLLNKYHEKIKEETIKLINGANSKAINTIDLIDTFDFEDSVLISSLKEGVWEPNTILRIYNIDFDDNLSSGMVKNDYIEKVNKEIKASKEISNIEILTEHGSTQPIMFRHSEKYEESIINKLYYPIENGDIFKIKNKFFVLVAQPCDLMLRGTKEDAGKRKSKYVTLLKLSKMDLTQDNIEDKLKLYTNCNYQYLLDYFDVNDLKSKFIIKFNKYLFANLDCLDLCTFNEEGNCEFSIVQNSELLPIPSEKRFNILKDTYIELNDKLKKVYDSICEEKREEMITDFYPKPFLPSTSIKFDKTEWEKDVKFDFKIQRIKKIKEPTSNFILNKYTHYLCRNAELHDFANL